MNYGVAFIEGLPKPLKEAEVIELYRKGDKESIDKVITHNVRLVLHIVKKYKQYQAIEQDLASIGLIGLIKGANSFDVNKNIRFATYVTRCIENEILMYFRKYKKNAGVLSLDEPLSIDWDGNELHLDDVLENEEAARNLEACEDKELMKKVREVVSSLPDKERNLIEKRFGFIDGKITTQKELAEELGISQSYISRIEKRALEKLKRQLKINNIMEYSDKIFVPIKKTNKVSSQIILTNDNEEKIEIGGGYKFFCY